MSSARLVVMRRIYWQYWWVLSPCPKHECRQESISLQLLRTHMAPSLVWHWLSTGLHWGKLRCQELRLSPDRAKQGEAVGDPADGSQRGSSPLAKNLWRGTVTHAQPPDLSWDQVSQISWKCQSQDTPWRPFHLLHPVLTATSLFGSGQILNSLLMRMAEAPTAQQGSPRRASHAMLAGACAAREICTKIPPPQFPQSSLAQGESCCAPPGPHSHTRSERQPEPGHQGGLSQPTPSPSEDAWRVHRRGLQEVICFSAPQGDCFWCGLDALPSTYSDTSPDVLTRTSQTNRGEATDLSLGMLNPVWLPALGMLCPIWVLALGMVCPVKLPALEMLSLV